MGSVSTSTDATRDSIKKNLCEKKIGEKVLKEYTRETQSTSNCCALVRQFHTLQREQVNRQNTVFKKKL